MAQRLSFDERARVGGIVGEPGQRSMKAGAFTPAIHTSALTAG